MKRRRQKQGAQQQLNEYASHDKVMTHRTVPTFAFSPQHVYWEVSGNYTRLPIIKLIQPEIAAMFSAVKSWRFKIMPFMALACVSFNGIAAQPPRPTPSYSQPQSLSSNLNQKRNPWISPSLLRQYDPDKLLHTWDGKILVDSKNLPVVLKNNPSATNRPLSRVVEFIRTNTINDLPYVPGEFTCVEFAVALHDAAERAGIRCALVGMDFQKGIGHSLNAFQTTDKGLVYVDCTGGMRPVPNRNLFDTIAYIKVGQRYGRLPLEIGAFDPNRYERYLYVMSLWENTARQEAMIEMERRKWESDFAAFKTEVEKFNMMLAQNPALEAAEDIQKRRQQLEAKRKEFAKRWEDIQTRAGKIDTQFRRLQVRYDQNPSPVTHVQLWW